MVQIGHPLYSRELNLVLNFIQNTPARSGVSRIQQLKNSAPDGGQWSPSRPGHHYPNKVIVAYIGVPRIFFGGGGGLRQEFFFQEVQKIQLRTDGRENGDLEGGSPLVRGFNQFANQ
jgi:hypothetical protein